MKRRLVFIIVLIIFSTKTFAVEYKEALNSFNSGKYKKSYDQFYKLTFNNLTNPEYNFYLGLSALKLKKYDEAIVSFERSIALNPKHLRSQLELSRAYFESGALEEAEVGFNELLAENIPEDIKTIVKQYLTAIEELRKKHSFSISAQLGVGYDSNMNSGNDYKFLGTEVNPVKGSMAITQNILLSHKYKKRGRYTVSTTAGHYAKVYKEDSTGNFSLPYISVVPLYYMRKMKLATPLNYAKVNLDSGETISITSLKVEPIFNTITPYIGYSIKGFSNDDDKSSKQQSVGVKLSPKPFYIDTSYSAERKDKGTRTDVDNNKISLLASYSKDINIFNSKYSTNTSLKVEKRSDLDTNAVEGKKREDSQNKLSITINKKLDKQSSLGITLSHTTNSSNIVRHQYNKTTLNFILNTNSGPLQ